MFFEKLKSTLLLNITDIFLFLILIWLAHMLFKPLVKKWIENNCITTLTYFFSTSVVCVSIMMYFYVLNMGVVTNIESFKNIFASLWISFITVGLILLIRFIAKSLSQMVKNKNTV